MEINLKNMGPNNQPVTKKELDQILDDKFHRWTHNEIVPTVEAMFKKFGNEIKSEIKKDIKASENRIITSNDKLAGEIKTDREKMMAKFMSTKQASDKLKKHDETLSSHEKWIKTLEAQPV